MSRVEDFNHPDFPEPLTLVEIEPDRGLYHIESDEEGKTHGLFGICCFCAIPDRMQELAESEFGDLVCTNCLEDLMGSAAEKRRARQQTRFETSRAQELYRLEHPKTVTSLVRRKVFERDQYRCRYCGGFKASLINHLIPKSRGGSHTVDNLVTACKPCTIRKGARTPEEAGMTLIPLDGHQT